MLFIRESVLVVLDKTQVTPFFVLFWIIIGFFHFILLYQTQLWTWLVFCSSKTTRILNGPFWFIIKIFEYFNFLLGFYHFCVSFRGFERRWLSFASNWGINLTLKDILVFCRSLRIVLISSWKHLRENGLIIRLFFVGVEVKITDLVCKRGQNLILRLISWLEKSFVLILDIENKILLFVDLFLLFYLPPFLHPLLLLLLLGFFRKFSLTFAQRHEEVMVVTVINQTLLGLDRLSRACLLLG